MQYSMFYILVKYLTHLRLLFFRKKHSDQLKNLMVDIISVILAEYEAVPFALLELLFARIIDPEKVFIM